MKESLLSQKHLECKQRGGSKGKSEQAFHRGAAFHVRHGFSLMVAFRRLSDNTLSIRWALTIVANLTLFAAVCKWRPSRTLCICQTWAIASTVIMLCAHYLIPDVPATQHLYNDWWTFCDLADTAAECFIGIWLWRTIVWDGDDKAGPLLIIAICAHLYIKQWEYWAHDPFRVADWIQFYRVRQWLNPAIIVGMIYKVCADAPRSQYEEEVPR